MFKYLFISKKRLVRRSFNPCESFIKFYVYTMYMVEIEKTVIKSGNGGSVYVPKEWIGGKVVVTLKKEPPSIHKDILEMIGSNLKYVVGVYLYGSHARNEQSDESDIDVIIVADKQFRMQKKPRYHIEMLYENGIEQFLYKNPLPFLPMIKESVPIINSKLLERLNKVKLNKKRLLSYMKEWIAFSLKSIEETVNFEIEDKNEYLEDVACIYSLILRSRELYIIDCLLTNKAYSNKGYNEFMVKGGVDKKALDDMINVYKTWRDEGKIAEIKVSLNLIKKIVLKLKGELDGQRRKAEASS